MAIEEQTARTVFKGDGSTRAFPVTWYLDAEENVIVKMTNVTTAQVKTLKLGTDYTVTPSDDEYPTNGAVINYPKNSVTPALGSDYRLTVIRNVPYTQSFVFPNNTRLLPKNIEGGLDGLELQIQQVNDKADNAVSIPAGMDYDNDEFVAELFDKASEASQSAQTATTKANEAKESATSASQSAQTATTKAQEASSSATNASQSAQTATTKAQEASQSAQTATTKAQEATTKADEAKSSATNASQSAQTATTKANEASQSAQTATTKAQEAKSSATSAKESEDKALDYAKRAEQASGSVGNPVNDVVVQDNKITVTKGVGGSTEYTVNNVANANTVNVAQQFKFGVGGASAVYRIFARTSLYSDNSYGNSTFIITSTGDFGTSPLGSYIVNISNRVGARRMYVRELISDGSNSTTFGYYKSGSYFYFGLMNTSYSGECSVTPLNISNFSGHEVGNYKNDSTVPSGWENVTIEKLAPKESPSFSGTPTAPTPSTSDNGTRVATTKFVHDVIDEALVGTVIYSPVLKSGFVKLNGATVNRSDYPRLVTFATKNGLFTSNNSSTPYLFGTGNGSTTFVLPDYRNRFIEGGDSASVKEAGLPNITGYAYVSAGDAHSSSGALKYTSETAQHGRDGNSWYDFKLNFDASGSNAIYGKSSTVQPPAFSLIPQIKY